jgi:hypothetical protein
MKRVSPRNRYLLVASLVASALSAMIACTESDSGSNEDDKEAQREKAREYYVTRVHPAAGSCVGCHAGAQGPRFMAEEAQSSYAAIERAAGLIAAPKISPLVQYVHKDPAVVISADQRSLITQWLSLEATARGLEGAVEKPKSITEAYKQFSDCMNFDVWSYYRMGDLAFSQTDFDGPCMGCHSTGQGSAWLSAASRETFEKSKQFPYIQKFVVGKLNAAGSFEELQPSKRFAAKADEICPPDATTCHPRFGLPPNIRDMVDNFVSTTLQNLATGTCNSGIVVPTSDAGPRDAGGG